jgi:hypothetical protein
LDTLSAALTTRTTVATETPASLATSLTVARWAFDLSNPLIITSRRGSNGKTRPCLTHRSLGWQQADFLTSSPRLADFLF